MDLYYMSTYASTYSVPLITRDTGLSNGWPELVFLIGSIAHRSGTQALESG